MRAKTIVWLRPMGDAPCVKFQFPQCDHQVLTDGTLLLKNRTGDLIAMFAPGAWAALTGDTAEVRG